MNWRFNWLSYLLRGLLAMALGGVLLWLWNRSVSLDQVMTYLHHTHLESVVMAWVCFVLAIFLRSCRWRLLLKPIASLGPQTSFELYLSGQLLNFLTPFRLGELAKGYFLRLRNGVPISTSLPAIITDRVFDFLAVFGFVALAPWLAGARADPQLVEWVLVTGLVGLVMVSVVYALLLWRVDLLTRLTHPLLRLLPARLPQRAEVLLHAVITGLDAIRQGRRYAARLLALSLGASACEGLMYLLVFLSLGENISYPFALLGSALLALSLMLPMPPGQVGSLEFYGLAVFSGLLGLSQDVVGAAFIIVHAITAVALLVWGGLSTVALVLTGRAMRSRRISPKSVNPPIPGIADSIAE